ncbi:MAG: PocR ligand-binding domain-containing protein [Candidatus Aminicenantales bacterium]|jgi:AraC-like DNA-binding protein
MEHSLELIFTKEVQTIFDYFSSIFNTRILFYSLEGKVIKVGLDRQNSRYCHLIQTRLGRREACVEIDRKGRDMAKTQSGTVHYLCHAGLKDVVTPITNGGHLIGYVGFGQYRQNANIPKDVMKEWVRRYPNSSELMAAYMRLPYYSKDKETHIIGLFSFLVHYIVSQQMISAKGDFVLNKILSYIDAHIDQAIQLDDVALFVSRSHSAVSHLFRTKLNMSFKEALLNRRFDKAEEYFRTSPHLLIAEVAEKIGYVDPFYFSRIYKKYRNVPPSKFRSGSTVIGKR